MGQPAPVMHDAADRAALRAPRPSAERRRSWAVQRRTGQSAGPGPGRRSRPDWNGCRRGGATAAIVGRRRERRERQRVHDLVVRGECFHRIAGTAPKTVPTRGGSVPDPSVLTAADIARLAGVTRGAVSNWRRRHPDFPEPSGGTDASPAYDRSEVEAWLAARGALPELPPEERLWQTILEMAGEGNLGDAVLWAAELVQAISGHAMHRMTRATFRAAKTRATHDRVARDLAELVAKCGAQETVGMLTGRYLDATGGQATATPKPVADLMAE